MAVCTLDRTVLVSDARIVARRRHAVMGAQLFVAPRQVFLRLAREIAERRRQAVAAMLLRDAAERPQCALQAFGERMRLHFLPASETGRHFFDCDYAVNATTPPT
jgi:hypothetical protein